jgi:hypothetical protein
MLYPNLANQLKMKILKPIVIIVMVLGLGYFPAAGQRSKLIVKLRPEQAVAALYKQHQKQSPFFQHQQRSLVDRYFDKEVADLIWNIHNPPDEVGPLDGDPLYNAQDMEIKNFVVHPAKVTGASATVLVTFTNFGKKQEVKFLLASRPSGWKITNIKYDDGTDLIGIIKWHRL